MIFIYVFMIFNFGLYYDFALSSVIIVTIDYLSIMESITYIPTV